jgi:ketosteroid isomerase-like protein
MILGSLRINTLSPEASAWYWRYIASVDAKDLDGYCAFLDEDCTLQVNNHFPILGRGMIREILRQSWATYAELEHEPLNIYGSDTNFVLEALNHYRRLDGQKVTTRATAFTDRDEGGLVKAIRLYSDVQLLFR